MDPGSHVIEMVATDSQGKSDMASMTITISTLGGFGPENTANCVLWLDASDMDPAGIETDSSIFWWSDKSGLTNNTFARYDQAKQVLVVSLFF